MPAKCSKRPTLPYRSSRSYFTLEAVAVAVAVAVVGITLRSKLLYVGRFGNTKFARVRYELLSPSLSLSLSLVR